MAATTATNAAQASTAGRGQWRAGSDSAWGGGEGAIPLLYGTARARNNATSSGHREGEAPAEPFSPPFETGARRELALVIERATATKNRCRPQTLSRPASVDLSGSTWGGRDGSGRWSRALSLRPGGRLLSGTRAVSCDWRLV